MEDTVDAHGEGPNNDNTDARGQISRQRRVPESEFVADCYNMKHKNRGVAIIINNMNFQGRLPSRLGSDRDADSMYKLLDILQFSKIIRRDDQNVSDIKKLLSEVAKMDHSDNDCLVCVFLSHGEEGYVHGTDNKVPMDELTSFFKGSACQGLVGKPKVFIIQACRGSELDHGATVADGAEADEMEADIIRRIPTEADFLMAYSVLPGYYSWRNTQNGSWFIQAIFDVFKQNYQTMDILTMLTRVNKRVAYDFESNTNNINMSGKKQIPCITSMLTKDLYFVEPVKKKQ